MGDKFTNQAQQIAAHGNHLSREIGLLKGNFTEKFNNLEKTTTENNQDLDLKMHPNIDFDEIAEDLSEKIGSKIKIPEITEIPISIPSNIDAASLNSYNASHVEQLIERQRTHLKRYIDTSRDILLKDMNKKLGKMEKTTTSKIGKITQTNSVGSNSFGNSCNFSELFDAHQRQRLLYK